ncbi:MAG: DNA gyrase inhibitor YacG [Pseudomonadota bacterium]
MAPPAQPPPRTPRQSSRQSPDQSRRQPRQCPICSRPAQARYAPFCSKRCADVDLGRWLTGAYAIPTDEAPARASDED